jgi:hypothetical protein
MRARVSHTPACDASEAASMTFVPPMPARRSAKAKALPVWPPPTISTSWSMPACTGTQLAGAGPSRRSASCAAWSGFVEEEADEGGKEDEELMVGECRSRLRAGIKKADPVGSAERCFGGNGETPASKASVAILQPSTREAKHVIRIR